MEKVSKSLRTSESHPIYADFVSLPPAVKGRLGCTFAPGKKHQGTVVGCVWNRDVDADLERLKLEYNMKVLVSLMTTNEYKSVCIHFNLTVFIF
jgi:hypothetical protein